MAAIAIATAFAGCSGSGNKKTQAQPPLVPVLDLSSVDTLLHRDYVADIQAIRNVEIRARVTGYLDKILVDEGQRVQKGDLLFQLDPTEFKTAVEQAAANVDAAASQAHIAGVERERVSGLVKKKVISPSELELADARLEAAKAAVRQAKAVKADALTKLSYTQIRAPFSGVIDRIPLKAGSLLDEGTLVTTLSDNNMVYAYFNVSENEYLRQQEGQNALKHGYAAQLVLADGSQHVADGIVETLSGEFNDNTSTITFRAKFNNPGNKLRHGASGKVRISSDVDSAILVPQKAVFEIQDRCYVYLVGADNKVKMKSFQPRLRFADSYIVRSGLTAGDRLVYEGIQNLRDGAVIRPQTTP